MGLYQRVLLPPLIDLACGTRVVTRQRAKVVPLARGRVLEVGAGSGHNLPHYDAGRVERLWALDPSRALWARAAARRRAVPFPVEFVLAPAEAIPLAAGSVDTIVVTYTLCSLADAAASTREMRRVLRAGGRLLFCEHGRAPDASVRAWQDRLDPLWRRLAGGCHLNRDIPRLLTEGGFGIRALDTMYLPGWRPAAFNYWGAAE